MKQTNTSIPWPYLSENAVSEFDSEDYLFGKAFPWLFPGSFGDYKFFREFNIDEARWANMLLNYEDGRFGMCKMWGFFMNNFID